jgi:NAD(P)-dependent dehydrogenase (short-subunit alcohol dehydrogenase family)
MAGFVPAVPSGEAGRRPQDARNTAGMTFTCVIDEKHPMQHLEGKTAVVTGAASGIGFGLARTFARHGMSVVLCDLRGDRLDAALAEIRALGAPAIAVVTDVSDRTTVEHAAAETVKAFGKVHVLCNNAGVTMHGKSVADLTPEEWDWIIGVNLYGVIHGVRTFLPLIRAYGEEGHIVNTASAAGFQINVERRSGAYATTKYAVVGFTESLHRDLADTPIGVSVLAPAAVNTRIYESANHRPERFGGPYRIPGNARLEEELRHGLAPDTVGERVVRAIRDRELFIFTHMETREWLERRHQRLMEAYRACDHWLANLQPNS